MLNHQQGSSWPAKIKWLDLRCFRQVFYVAKHEDEDLTDCHALLNYTFEGISNGGPEQQLDENALVAEVTPYFFEDLPSYNAMPVATAASKEMGLSDVPTNISKLASLLRMCGDRQSLPQGRQAHTQVIENRLEQHPSIQNPLVQLYAKCRAIDDALNLFVDMHHLSTVSWNVMISAYLREGQGEEALQLFDSMQHKGITPTKVTYICMLSACVNEGSLVIGKLLHARISASRFQADVVVCTALLNMYGRCGSMEDACRTFYCIEDRDVISWNAMIEAYHDHGLYKESFALSSQMQAEGVMPNWVTLISMFDACTRLETVIEGKWLHRYAIDTGFIVEVIVGTAVVSMYGKCGRLKEAVLLFERLCERDTVLWNAMIASYCLNGQCRHALQLLDQMLLEGFVATKVTYASVLNACASRAAIFSGQCVHACIVDSWIETDLDVGNAIVNMYGKVGSCENALRTFRKMPERDVVTWSAMIAAFAEIGQGKEALKAFHKMQQLGVAPNEVTIINILHAFEAESNLDEVKEIHDYISSHGFNRDVMIGTALISIYGKCGDLKDAQMVFDDLPKHDVLCWTAMISAHVQNRQGREAILLFDRMKKEGVMPDKIALANIFAACSELVDPTECELMHASNQQWGVELDDIVGSAVISMYGRFGKLNLSQMLFDSLPKQLATTWNAMMIVHIQHGQPKRALQLFYQMCSKGIIPDKDTFVSSLTACANEASLVNGEKVHALICDSGFVVNDVVGAALVSMYGKCGCPDTAQSVFDNMEKHDIILWNAMVGVHSQHGEYIKALQIIDHMQSQGCMLDTITLISFLNACSHAGLVDEGAHIIASMEDNFNIFPAIDHYVCVIDMLGRSGRSRDAEVMVNQMPYQPKAVSYMSLLGACQSLGNTHQGERVAGHMSELASENAGPYVSLANIYILQGQCSKEAVGA